MTRNNIQEALDINVAELKTDQLTDVFEVMVIEAEQVRVAASLVNLSPSQISGHRYQGLSTDYTSNTNENS